MGLKMNGAKNKNRNLVDVIAAFAEAMPGCTCCPLDEFCNRNEEGKRYDTCTASATAWLKTQIEEINKPTI